MRSNRRGLGTGLHENETYTLLYRARVRRLPEVILEKKSVVKVSAPVRRFRIVHFDLGPGGNQA